MGWRDKYRVHPAADVFPMMSDEELAALGADIKANGLQHPILLHAVKDADHRAGNLQLIDGRNRLEAMERAGIVAEEKRRVLPHHKDPVAHIIGLNIHRRHLTKQERADLIVAAIKAEEKPPQDEAVSKGGRGKVNPVKAKAVAAAAEHGISKATVERSLARADGKAPKPKPRGASASEKERCRADYARRWNGSADWQREIVLQHVVKESDPVALAARALAMMDADQLRRFSVMVEEHRANLGRKQASTLPQDGRSEVSHGRSQRHSA